MQAPTVLSCLLATVVFLLEGSSAWAQSTFIAFPRVTGPTAAGRGPVANGVIAGLEEAGLKVRRGDPLREAAEELETTVYDVEVALVADCDYLLVVELAKQSGRFVATARIIRTEDGRELEPLEHRYSGKRAAASGGRALAERIAESIDFDRSRARLDKRVRPNPTGDRSNRGLTSVGETPDTAVVGPDDPANRWARKSSNSDVSVRATASRNHRRSMTEARPEDPSVEAELAEPAARAEETPERSRIRLAAGVGSRVLSTYAVNVGGDQTRLGYSLEPLLAVDARALLELPWAPVGLELDFGFRPVAFSLSTEPQVSPTEPGGQLVDFGGAFWWRIDLEHLGKDARLTLTPMLGAHYSALSVEEQGPAAVVTSWTSVTLDGGLRLGLELDERWGFDLEGTGGTILSFSESPTTTGERGQGFRLGARARGRYWFSGQFAAELALGLDYQSVSTFGTGNRAVFDGDPQLLNSDIRTEAFDVGLAAVFAI